MPPEDERRAAAVKRLNAKRDFRTHVAVYVIVNTGLVVIWALSGAGYFWPVWAIFGWGIGLAAHAWSIYGERPFSEEELRAEMERGEPGFDG